MKTVKIIVCFLLAGTLSRAQGFLTNYVIEVKSVGETINTKLKETNPVLSPDGKTIYFSRPGIAGNEPWFSQLGESRGAPSEMALPFSSKGLSVMQYLPGVGETKSMLILRNDLKKSGLAYCLSSDRREWDKPKEIKIRKVDDLSGSECFLTSDRKNLIISLTLFGGHGGKDLYRCRALGEGKFESPVNLGDVNTEADETSPFLAQDGTLYFTSNRKDSRGEGDIYAASLVMDSLWEWEPAVNMGDKINTAFDETGFTISSGNIACFSRAIDENDADIYQASLSSDEQEPMVKLTGKVLTRSTNLPLGAIVAIETSEGQWVSMTNNNPATGEYVLEVPGNRKYNVYGVAGDRRSEIAGVDLTSKPREFEVPVIYFGGRQAFASTGKDPFILTSSPNPEATTSNPSGAEDKNLPATKPTPNLEGGQEIASIGNAPFIPSSSPKQEQFKKELNPEATTSNPAGAEDKNLPATKPSSNLEGGQEIASAGNAPFIPSFSPKQEQFKKELNPEATTSNPAKAEDKNLPATKPTPNLEGGQEIASAGNVPFIPSSSSKQEQFKKELNPEATTSNPAKAEDKNLPATKPTPNLEGGQEIASAENAPFIPSSSPKQEQFKKELNPEATTSNPAKAEDKNLPATKPTPNLEGGQEIASAENAPFIPSSSPKQEQFKKELNPEATTSNPSGVEDKNLPATKPSSNLEGGQEIASAGNAPFIPSSSPKQEQFKKELNPEATTSNPVGDEDKNSPANPVKVVSAATAPPDRATSLKNFSETATDKVLFGVNQAVVSQAYLEQLDRIASDLVQQPSRTVRLAGYADISGPGDWNLNLSKQRAKSVAQYLIKKGVPSSQIDVQYYGEKNPVGTALLSRRVEISFGEDLVSGPSVVNFDFDRAAVREDYDVLLDRIARQAQGGSIVELLGYTDTTGTSEYNVNLSKRRAESVAHALINRGVPAERTVTKYYGEENIIDPVRKGRNRRVEICIR